MSLKRTLKTDEDNIHPIECPKDDCPSRDEPDKDPICVSNIDGYECMICGCWFEAYRGELEWARDNLPQECY